MGRALEVVSSSKPSKNDTNQNPDISCTGTAVPSYEAGPTKNGLAVGTPKSLGHASWHVATADNVLGVPCSGP